MATYLVPYENRSIDIPDDGEVFQSDYNPSGTIYVRKGNTIYSLSLESYARQQLQAQGAQFKTRQELGLSGPGPTDFIVYPDGRRVAIDSGTLREIGATTLKQQTGIDASNIKTRPESNFADFNNTIFAGGNFQRAQLTDLNLLRSTPTQGEVITQQINPANPQGIVVTSNTQGELFRHKSTYDTLIEAGATPEQAAALSGHASSAPYSQQQLTNAGVVAPTPQPVAGRSLTPIELGNGQTVYADNQGTFYDAQGNVVSSSAVAGSTAGAPPINPNNPLAPVLSELERQLGSLEQRGQVLNPNIDLTPEQMAKYLTQAKNEIDPFYSNLLTVARENLLKSAGYGVDELRETEAKLERTYGNAFRSLGEGAAEQGFALSGIRQREERDLATDTASSISDARRKLSQAFDTNARTFAGEFGGANIPTAPTLSAAPTVSPGESLFGRSASSMPVYNISDSILSGLKGTRQFEQEANIQSRVSELEQAERERLALAQGRALTF